MSPTFSQHQAHRYVTVVLLISTLISSVTAIDPESKIVVTGYGKKSVTTSVAVISLSIEDTKPIAAQVQASVAAKSNALLAYLNVSVLSGVITELQTTGISLRPEYNYSSSPRSVTGYSGSNTVQFTTNISSAGAILDGSVRNGATRIESVQFKATKKVQEDARSDAVETAVENALNEAKSATRPLYLVLGTAINIQVENEDASTSFPTPYTASLMPETVSDSATQVLPQIQIITAKVIVTFSAHNPRRMGGT